MYGEVIGPRCTKRTRANLALSRTWSVLRALLSFLEASWQKPGSGIWETRGPPRQFTYAKVMSWVAFDRALKVVERLGLEGPADRWRKVRDEIHAEVCARGFDARRNTFSADRTGSRNSTRARCASLPWVLAAGRPARRGHPSGHRAGIDARWPRLRYPSGPGGADDGLLEPEGIPRMQLRLADCYAQMGRIEDATKLFEQLLALRNDVGLLAEEYDPRGQRQLGNVPQGFSHLALIQTAFNLTPATRALQRSARALSGAIPCSSRRAVLAQARAAARIGSSADCCRTIATLVTHAELTLIRFGPFPRPRSSSQIFRPIRRVGRIERPLEPRSSTRSACSTLAAATFFPPPPLPPLGGGAGGGGGGGGAQADRRAGHAVADVVLEPHEYRPATLLSVARWKGPAAGVLARPVGAAVRRLA